MCSVQRAPLNARVRGGTKTSRVFATTPNQPVRNDAKDGSPLSPAIRIESRRIVLATAIILAGTAGKALALGKSAKELARESAARRQKLKEASAAMREKGKAASAFEDSKFGLGEDATTPNRVNRTGEGGAGI